MDAAQADFWSWVCRSKYETCLVYNGLKNLRLKQFPKTTTTTTNRRSEGGTRWRW